MSVDYRLRKRANAYYRVSRLFFVTNTTKKVQHRNRFDINVADSSDIYILTAYYVYGSNICL